MHIVGSVLWYWILTDKGTVISSTAVQHVTQDTVATGYCQSHIAQLHEKLDIRLSQGNHSSVVLDGFDDFVNDDDPNPFEVNEEPYYTGPLNMLDLN